MSGMVYHLGGVHGEVFWDHDEVRFSLVPLGAARIARRRRRRVGVRRGGAGHRRLPLGHAVVGIPGKWWIKLY